MLLTLFAVGTFWFWVLFVAHFCILLALIEHEKAGWATITMIATFALLHFFGDFNVVSAAFRNPVTALCVVLGYFAAGTAWAVAKWWFYVGRCREQYDELKARFLERKGVAGPAVPDALKKEWKEYLSQDYEYSRRTGRKFSSESVIPKAGEHKARITTWMCYWPWSMVWTLLSDWVKRIWNEVYRQIKGLLQSIANQRFRGVEDDLAEPPVPPPPAASDPDAATPTPRGVQKGGAANTI